MIVQNFYQQIGRLTLMTLEQDLVSTQTSSLEKPSLLLTTLAVALMKDHFQIYLNFAVSY